MYIMITRKRKPPKYCGGKTKSSSKSKTRKLLPKLKKVNYEGKKYLYKLDKTAKCRRMALDEGIQDEIQRMGMSKRQAAVAKKGRLNILRIYRRNKNLKDCEKITRDMKYIDKKYGLGVTDKICGKPPKN